MLANGDDRVGGDEARGGHGGHADAREGTVTTAEEVGAGRLLPGEHAIGGPEKRSVGATVPSQEAFVGEGRADQLDVAPLSHVGNLLLDRLLEHRHQAQSVRNRAQSCAIRGALRAHWHLPEHLDSSLLGLAVLFRIAIEVGPVRVRLGGRRVCMHHVASRRRQGWVQ